MDLGGDTDSQEFVGCLKLFDCHSVVRLYFLSKVHVFDDLEVFENFDNLLNFIVFFSKILQELPLNSPP